jgi:hypothetical protein
MMSNCTQTHTRVAARQASLLLGSGQLLAADSWLTNALLAELWLLLLLHPQAWEVPR